MAVAGDCKDESFLRKVDVFNEAYRMKESGDVLNWFDITAPEGYFSVNDKISEIMNNKKGKRLMMFTLLKMVLKAKLKSKSGQGKKKTMDLSANSGIMKLVGGMSVKRVLSMAGTMGPEFQFEKEDILKINKKLNKIRK